MRRADVLIPVCPPHAAAGVAHAATGFAGIYLDANAISPMSVREIASLTPRCVDGGIIGPPPHEPGTTRLYLSGPEADAVAELFAGTVVATRVVSPEIGAASATKLAYAAWSKGAQALLLAIRAALTKGWRWQAEMDEIADTFAAAGLLNRSRGRDRFSRCRCGVAPAW